MEADTRRGPGAVVQPVRQAINAHDLDALVGCFSSQYRSEFPAHPDRAFSGYDQVRKNWSQIFAAVPDLHAELRGLAVDRDAIWTEWEWRGTRVDGAPYVMRGVTVQGVDDNQLTWARLYMEPVQEGAGIDAAVRAMLGRKQEE